LSWAKHTKYLKLTLTMITQNTEETLKIFPMPWGLVEIEEL
jgi:hypothetical protein